MDGGRIRKEKVVGFTRFTTIDSILNKHFARSLRARDHLGPVYMEVGTPGRGGNRQVE